MSDDLLLNRDGDVAELVINRPEKLNAIKHSMYLELPDIVVDVENDKRIKVLVVRGAGDRAFAAGADISEFRSIRSDAESTYVYNRAVDRAEAALAGMTKPTIAMVHGVCIGGGCAISMACDLRLASDQARFAITPANLGIVYNFHATRRLVGLVGTSQANHLLFTASAIDAERALRIGLVTDVHPAAELDEVTRQLADRIALRSQVSVRRNKEIVNLIRGGQLDDDEHTLDLRDGAFASEDYAEGVAAFLEKREPTFTWR